MFRRFRPFRSRWSLLLVFGALALTSAACVSSPSEENTGNYCQQHPENC